MRKLATIEMVSKQDCIEALRTAEEQLGHSPTASEYRDLDISPSVRTIQNHFGRWDEAKEKAGLELNPCRWDGLSVNGSYFETLNKESAYWLGMLYGDGSVDSVGRGRLSLQLNKDPHHVKRFAEDIESEHSVTEQGSVDIRDENLLDSLRSHGLDENKTFSSALPQLENSDLRASFVRGLMDADGSILNKNGVHRRFSITGSNRERFRKMEEWLPVEGTVVEVNTEETTIYRLQVYRHSRLVKLYNWMYPDGEDTYPMLERKYSKVQRAEG
jgi:hypothetical protein